MKFIVTYLDEDAEGSFFCVETFDNEKDAVEFVRKMVVTKYTIVYGSMMASN